MGFSGAPAPPRHGHGPRARLRVVIFGEVTGAHESRVVGRLLGVKRMLGVASSERVSRPQRPHFWFQMLRCSDGAGGDRCEGTRRSCNAACGVPSGSVSCMLAARRVTADRFPDQMVFRAQDESPAPPRGLGKGEQPARGESSATRRVCYTIRPARVTRGRRHAPTNVKALLKRSGLRRNRILLQKL